MVDFLIPFLIATILGFLAGMGVGGGSLLLLWLTQVVSLSQEQSRIINLLFFLPASIAATLLRAKNCKPDGTVVIPGMIVGCSSAILFSLLQRHLNIELIKKLLGGLLIFAGLREIFYRPRKAR